MFGFAKRESFDGPVTISPFLLELDAALERLEAPPLAGSARATELGACIRVLAGIAIELADRVVALEKRLESKEH